MLISMELMKLCYSTGAALRLRNTLHISSYYFLEKLSQECAAVIRGRLVIIALPMGIFWPFFLTYSGCIHSYQCIPAPNQLCLVTTLTRGCG